MLFATFELTNVYTGVPDRFTVSPLITVTRLADPLAVAANVRSYTLLLPVRPVTTRLLAVMLPLSTGCVRL